VENRNLVSQTAQFTGQRRANEAIPADQKHSHEGGKKCIPSCPHWVKLPCPLVFTDDVAF
jgi:hypothetical protein